MPRRTLRTRFLPTVAIVAASFGGCSGPDTAADPSGRTEQETARLISDEATDAQRPHLEDGVVTVAEREEAFLAYIGCLEANGTEVLWYDLNPYGDGIADRSDILDEAGMIQVDEDCRKEHYHVVGKVFVEQNRPTAEQEAQWWSETAECLGDLGFEVPADPAMEDLIEIAPLDTADCYDLARGIERSPFSVP